MRTDENRYADSIHTEMIKQRYKELGFSDQTATAAATAEVTGNAELLKRAFDLHSQELADKATRQDNDTCLP